jgi:uncharacterized protein (TIGR03435 family)
MNLHSPSKPGRPLSFVAAIVLCASVAHGQPGHSGPAQSIALAATLPAYDVVSVKQNKTSDGSFNMDISDSDDRFTATNVPLKTIVEVAYDLRDDQIFGISGPVSSVNFDVEAKVLGPDGGTPPKLSDKQLQAMVIPLLADRFHLKAHLQTKILPVYDLVVLRGGPKIQFSQAELKAGSWNSNRSDREISFNFKGATMADLVSGLSDGVGRTVIDKTGLKGTSDFTLKWTDDAADAPAGPVLSVFTAVQEQLGLKLQPGKGPVDTLVVDQVAMPSEN